MRIFITGIGAISAIGNNVEENYNSLISQKSGIKKLKYLETTHSKDTLFGECSLSDNEMIELLELDKNGFYTRTALLAMTAAKEAFYSSGCTSEDCRTGIVSGTTVAGMGQSEKFYDKYLNSDFSNGYINTHEAADSTEKIAEYLNITDYMTTISTACSSSANAIIYGARLIKNGVLDRVVVGGADSLSRFTVNGFKTLMILDKQQCKPYDRDRKGLNLGEAAAYLVLESEDLLKKNNRLALAELKGYANTNDAYHQTASSPDGYGAFLAMSQAVKNAKLKTADIDYINAHGTGTPNNDLTEGLAIQRLFDKEMPLFSSTKAFTGHTLAAAGSLEAVFSILSLNQQVIFPNMFFENQIEELEITPETKLIENIKVNNILSNSFGFGGNDTSLIFSRVDNLNIKFD